MSTSNTFSLLFILDPKKAKNDEAIIYVRITINKRRAVISTKRKIPVDLWDNVRKKVRGNSAAAKSINEYLDLLTSQIYQCYQKLTLNGNFVTAQLVKAKYLGQDDSKTLIEIIDYHARKIGNSLAPGTVRNFSISCEYVKKFLVQERKTSNVFLSELDYKFLCDFEKFLVEYYPKGHPRAMTHNTVMKHIQRLRKIVTLAYNMEWTDRDPFRRWKNTFEKKEREFLSANELSNLENYDFPLDRLDRVRDLFVFSCYTGISYVDIMNLKLNNVSMGIDGNNWIISKRQKTKTPIKIPLLDPARELIKKYGNHPMTIISGTLLPVITNEKLNVYLKEVALICGINKNLTFHMARHTFATTVTLSNGVPIETVSKMLGHTKISTTQIYARVLENKISEDMDILREKLKRSN